MERAEYQARVKGAVDYVREIEAKGEKPCLKAVADKFLIARPTLSQRVSGKSKSKQEESEKRRAIPVEAEKVLVDYLSEASRRGFPGPEPRQYWFMDAEDPEDLLIQLRSSSTHVAPTTRSQTRQKRAEPEYRDDSGGEWSDEDGMRID